MRKWAIIWVLGWWSAGAWGQTTYDWLDTAPDGNFKQGAAGARWNPGGLWDEPPSVSATRLRFNNNAFPLMTNNVTAGYILGQIFFGSGATSSRSISGNSVQFFEYGITWPRIENQSTVLHTISFPFAASTNSGFNMELVASSGALSFGGDINNNGRTIQVYGNNVAIDGSNRFIRIGNAGTGILSGNGVLNISQFGVARLAAAHTYTGETQIDNGELWIESGGSIAAGSGIFVGNGGQPANVAKLWLSNTAGSTTFSNNFTINNGNATTREIGGLNTSGTHTFSGNITNNSTTGGLLLSTINAGGTVEYSGVLSGGGAYTIQGPGTTVISGTSPNTYTGASAANGGTLVLNKSAGVVAIPTNMTVATGVTLRTDAANQWGTGTPSLVTLNGTATLNLNNNNQRIALASASTNSTVTLGSATLEINNTETDTYAGVISGTGNLVKTNTGTQVLSGANTYTGTTTISGGTLRLAAANVIADASNVVLNGGTFSTGAAAGFSEVLGTLNLNSNSTIALGTGSHNLSFAVSNSEIWTGSLLTINGWTGPNDGVGVGTAGRIFIGNSANGITPSQLSRIVFNISSTLYSAVQLSTGEIVASGATPLYYGGATAAWNTANWSTNNAAPYTNAWSDGRHAIFNISSPSLTGASVNFPFLTVNENTTISTSGGTIGAAGQVSRIIVASGRIMDFSNQAFSTSQTYGIIKNGPGTLALNGNTYGGGFTLNEGLVVARGINAMGGNTTSPGPLNINGGAIGADGSLNFSNKYSVINVGGDFTLGSSASPSVATANLTFNTNIILGSSVTRTITLGGTGTYTLNGIISGTGSNLVLDATAVGTLELGGANTYGGNTTINGGTLRLNGGADRLPTTTGLMLGNISGALLNLNGQNQTVASLYGAGTNGGNIALGAGTLTVNQTTTTTYSGQISGTGSLTKTNTGILTLGHAANTFTGPTTISAGELRLNPSTTTASYASQVVLNGGKLSTTGIASSTVFTNSSTLNLSASSSIDLGSNTHEIRFANSSAVSWTGSTTLTINNWSGTAENAGTAGRIFFGNSSAGLTAQQLAQITFAGYPGIPILLATGELVPGVGVTYTWNGSSSNDWGTPANWSPNGNPGSADLVVIPGTGSYTNPLTITGNRTCNSFTVTSNGSFSTAAGSALTITGNFVFSSSANPSFDCNSTLNISSPFDQNIPALNYGNLNLTGGPRTLANSGTIGICGTYTPTSGVTTITGSTVSFNGSGVQVVPGTHNYNALVIANTNTSPVTMGANFSVVSGITINDDSYFEIQTGRTLTLSGGTSQVNGRLRNSNTFTQSGGTLSFGPNSLYEHNITGGSLPVATWDNTAPGATCAIIGWAGSTGAPGNLTPSGGFSNFTWNSPGQSGSPNFAGALQLINRTLTVTNTGVGNRIFLSNASNGSLQVGAIVVNGGILASNNNAGVQNISAGTISVTSGTLQLEGNGTGTTTVSGLFSHTGGTIIRNSGTQIIEFNGNINQTVESTVPANISGQVNFRVNNPNGITIPNGSTLPINGGTTLQISQGNITLNSSASITYGNLPSLAVLEYNPSGSTAISTKDEWPLTGMRRVRINNTSSAAITLNASREMGSNSNDIINFDNGRLALGNYDLTLLNNEVDALTRTNGYAETNGTGQLIRTTLSSDNKTYLFPVGNDGAYTPVTLNFATNSLAGRQVGVRCVDVVHPFMAPNPDPYLNNRYWVTTLSDASGTYSYTPTFNFISGDVAGTVTDADLRLSRWNGTVWSNISNSSATATSLTTGVALTQITGNLSEAQWSGRGIKLPVDYTWSFAGSGSWTTSTNWTPNGVPTTEDMVRFTHSSNYTISDVPTSITLRNLLLSGTGTTTLTTPTTGTLSLSGGTNPVFSIGAGSTLIVSGTQTLNTVILSGATGNVAGKVQLRAEGSVVNHTLEAVDAGGLTFTNGSTFTAGSNDNSNFAGNPFGNAGNLNTVIFQNGSTFEQITGANPFGLTQPSSKVVFQNGSTYLYNDNRTSAFVNPSISGRTYGHFVFNSTQNRNPEAGTGSWSIQDLRVINSGQLGINLGVNGSISGNIEVLSPGSLQFAPSSGSSTITVNSGSLQTISGAGSLTIGPNATLDIQNTNGVNLEKNMTVNGNLTVNGRLNIPGENIASGTGTFTLNSGGTLSIGSINGITSASSASGNIQTGTRIFDGGGNYRYFGTSNQATGNGLPANITGTLSIANTGASGNNIVTLTTNNTTTARLNLEQGEFAAGTNQTLRIAASGIVSGTDGNQRIADATGGTIEFLGPGAVLGIPELYNVTIGNSGGGVDFTNNARINNLFTINNQGSVNPNAPRYAAGSTLIYNPGGTYNRNIEWGNTALTDNPGYPWHVTVQNGTILDLNTDAVSPPVLEMGGDLTIGNGSSNGQIYMNNNMNKRLVINGNLLIGGGTATGSILGLGNVVGGDLELRGNYTRTANGTFTPNNRAIFFTGSTNASINAPGPVTEEFPYVIVDKTNGINNTLTLNYPVDITNKLTLNKGRIITNETNILRITNPIPETKAYRDLFADQTEENAMVNGVVASSFTNNTGYIQGPLIRVTQDTGIYLFPVGHIDGPYRQYRPALLHTPTGSSNSQIYVDYRITPNPLAPPHIIRRGGFVAGVLNTEYWEIQRRTGSTPAKVTLYYINPANQTHWTAVGPAGTINNVAVVKTYPPASGTDSTWYFTYGPGGSGGFSSAEAVYWMLGQPNGIPIISKYVTSFSPFSIGHADYTVLPLILLSFNASLHAGDGLLQWQVADAADLRLFEVEHSSDGQRFHRIGTVFPNGGTSFSYRHAALPAGNHFYRLKMVEKDGRHTNSWVELLQVGATQTVIAGLMQNPVQGGQAILRLFSARNQQAEATLLDMAGRMLLRQRISLQTGANQLSLSMLMVPAGAYRLVIRTEDGVEKTIPLLK